MNILQIELRISVEERLLAALQALAGVGQKAPISPVEPAQEVQSASPKVGSTPTSRGTKRETTPAQKQPLPVKITAAGKITSCANNAAQSSPVRVDYERALVWGAERGLGMFKLDLDLVNLKRVQIGLAPFVLMAKTR